MFTTIESKLLSDGYIILEKYLKKIDYARMIKTLTSVGAFDYTNGTGAGNLLSASNEIFDFANEAGVELFSSNIEEKAVTPIKAFVLDKTVGNNWHIPWHQDLKIAVKKHLPLEGYSNWTMEAGIPHTEPPLSVLEGMTTLRIHLDDCTQKNGAINVVAGTHNRGKLTNIQIEHIINIESVSCCEIEQGGAMVFKPLLLHNSPLSVQVLPRRVLQIEYVQKDLLSPLLEWH